MIRITISFPKMTSAHLISKIYLNNNRNRKKKYMHMDHGRILPILWDNWWTKVIPSCLGICLKKKKITFTWCNYERRRIKRQGDLLPDGNCELLCGAEPHKCYICVSPGKRGVFHSETSSQLWWDWQQEEQKVSPWPAACGSADLPSCALSCCSCPYRSPKEIPGFEGEKAGQKYKLAKGNDRAAGTA